MATQWYTGYDGLDYPIEVEDKHMSRFSVGQRIEALYGYKKGKVGTIIAFYDEVIVVHFTDDDSFWHYYEDEIKPA